MENILDIIDSIAHEKGLSPDHVKEGVKTAFIQTAKRLVNPEFTYDAEIDETTKTIRVYQTITVVEEDDERLEGEEAAAYISLSRA
ncbi:MAG: transcription termination/antitermination protein NusA, partial [Epsilonproteobacteria bacterium]|nr:transcription termination/antitermination protein NusA [Campylobacterota bacterium]